MQIREDMPNTMFKCSLMRAPVSFISFISCIWSMFWSHDYIDQSFEAEISYPLFLVHDLNTISSPFLLSPSL